jgi:hypothetical protein
MTTRRRSDGSGRKKLCSPGRPGAAKREDRRRFWLAIAAGRSSEDAARNGGVSRAVGSRWFREAACHHPIPRHRRRCHRGGTCRLRSARRSRCCGSRLTASGRSPGAWVAPRLRSRASCGARAAAWRTAPARRSGTAWRAARRPKTARLASNDALRCHVEDRLAGRIARRDGVLLDGPLTVWTKRRHGPRQPRRWARARSPEQIPAKAQDRPPRGRFDAPLPRGHLSVPLRPGPRRGSRRELTACLRTGRALRVPRARVRGRGKSFVSPEVMTGARPAEAAARAVPGHWEGDPILGLRRSAIGTLVEREPPASRSCFTCRPTRPARRSAVRRQPACAGQ